MPKPTECSPVGSDFRHTGTPHSAVGFLAGSCTGALKQAGYLYEQLKLGSKKAAEKLFFAFAVLYLRRIVR